MKKKFKLFATIGSLALAVCMMTIGVLAASQVTLNVTSNVSFDTTSVLVDIAGSVTGAVEGQNDSLNRLSLRKVLASAPLPSFSVA